MSEFPQIQIDIGNSFSKVRCRYSSGNTSEVIRVQTADMCHDDFFSRFGVEIRDCVVLISSVAGRKQLNQVCCFFEQQGARSVFIASTTQSIQGLDLCYEDVTRLGVDRWLVMLAVKQLSASQGVCVVDFGTAITVDFLAEGGVHLGGYIIPGLSLLRKSLRVETANVEFGSEQAGAETRPGQSTSECVAHGINGMIKGMAGFVEEKCKETGCLEIVITGGDAIRYRRYFTMPVCLDSELVFTGLEIAYSYREMCKR